MNRMQRRKFEKDKKNKKIFEQPQTTEQPDFSSVPLVTMCQSIQMLINELQRRGFPVYDFDNKTKFVHGIKIIQGKVYFLVAEEGLDNEKI